MRTHRFSIAAGAFAMSVSTLVLTGWTLHLVLLEGMGSPITMKANAAIAIFAAGLSLLYAGRGATRSRVAAVAALVAATLGGATLLEHLTGINLGIDTWLFTEAPGALATASPGRMGPNGSLSLTVLGVALYCLQGRNERWATRAQALACVPLVTSLVAIVGVLYNATELYQVSRWTGIAPHTAGTIFILSTGVLAARTDAAPAALFVSEGPAGIVLRRFVLPALVLPLALGYLSIAGQRANLYDTGLGTAMFAVAVVIVLAVSTWRTAVALARVDTERRRTLDALTFAIERERAARDAAEGATRLKDEFLAVLSHELRTPLNVLLGWSTLLQNAPLGTARGIKAADVIARNGQLLVRLVEDLLDVSRVSTGQMQLSMAPVQVPELIAAALDALAPQAAAKELSVMSSYDAALVPMMADPGRLQQMLLNLLSNAIKFTPRGGRVWVQCSRAAEGIELTVRDSGIGIDAAFKPFLFQPFRMADSSTTRANGGLGLGLAIARHIAELHGGSISAESAGLGLGTTFVVRLPVVAAPAAAVLRDAVITPQRI